MGYKDTYYTVDANTCLTIRDTVIGCIGMKREYLSKIDEFLLKQFNYGKEHGEGYWSIYIGEFVDAVPELECLINEDTKIGFQKRFLLTFARRLAELCGSEIEDGEIDVYLYNKDEDDEDECDLYDGSHMAWKFDEDLLELF